MVNKFNIPQGEVDRLEILNAVESLLPEDISIVDISHKPYLERYTFKRSDAYADLDIYFNGKHIVSRVSNQTPSGISDLGCFIKECLQVLEKTCIGINHIAKPLSDLSSISQDLYTSFLRIESKLKSYNIQMYLISISNYQCRFCFVLDDKSNINYTLFLDSNARNSGFSAINRDYQNNMFNLIEEIVKSECKEKERTEMIDDKYKSLSKERDLDLDKNEIIEASVD